MRIAQLRQADLNLLVIFTVLAEERNVSRAASRLLLSQPAVTRAMQRLREMFHDDLLVRVSGNYESTPKGRLLLKELEVMLPRLDRLMAGAEFDPVKEEARFRLAGTDYASHVICIPLSKLFLSAGEHVSFDISPLTDGIFDAMERGRIDLLLHADDGRVPTQFSRQIVFEEEFVCLVANKSIYKDAISLSQYLDALHVGVTIFGGVQTIPEMRLEEQGLRRRCAFNVPYFAVAARAVVGTDLIATIPKRLALYEDNNPSLRILKAPKPLTRFRYLMAWHPRMDSDAAHIWLRNQVEQACVSLEQTVPTVHRRRKRRDVGRSSKK
jgi:DNA-binding transcriptional LysR family regulator